MVVVLFFHAASLFESLAIVSSEVFAVFMPMRSTDDQSWVSSSAVGLGSVAASQVQSTAVGESRSSRLLPTTTNGP